MAKRAKTEPGRPATRPWSTVTFIGTPETLAESLRVIDGSLRCGSVDVVAIVVPPSDALRELSAALADLREMRAGRALEVAK